MDQHIAELHNKVAPFTCEICKFSFTRNGDLKRHLETIHTEVRNFLCGQCPQKFDRWARLNRHISIEHDEATLFTCPKCSQHFKWKDNLNRHITTHHKEEKAYECDGCPQKFARWDNLKKHQDHDSHTFHYQCQFCQDGGLYFKSETEARKHFIFTPRSSDGKRSKTVSSCVNFEKVKKQRRERERNDELDKAKKMAEELILQWENMPEEEKERERELHREENVRYWRGRTEIWQMSEEKKERMLNNLINDCRTEHLSDLKMVTVMVKKSTKWTKEEKLEVDTYVGQKMLAAGEFDDDLADI